MNTSPSRCIQPISTSVCQLVVLAACRFGLSPGYIIGFGPFVAALVVLALTRGKVSVLGLLKRMVRWRVKPVWYAAAFAEFTF
jgi:hypothetical protein